MNGLSDPTEWFTWWSRLWREMYTQAIPFPAFAPRALTQPILPGWLVGNSINVTEQNSSSPETERDIVARYSYGRQLGRVIDVLGDLIESWPGGTPDEPSVRRFAELRTTSRRSRRSGSPGRFPIWPR